MKSPLRLKPRPDLPFSRPLAVDDVPETGLDLDFAATQAECAAIAAEADLPAVGAVAVHLQIARLGGGQRYEVAGALKATITQTCVVTLEPFDSAVEQTIETTFAPAPRPPAPERPQRGRATHAAPSPVPPPPAADVDAPDPIVDGVIDLGALAFEFLMLARDLYPRKPGAEFAAVVAGEPEQPDPSAFAALQRLKDRS